MSNALKLWRKVLDQQGITEEPVIASENDWVRVYSISSGAKFSESKFLTGEAKFTVDLLRRRWPGFRPEDRVEFAQAYAVKPTLDSEDQLILDFLLEVANDPIAMILANLLPKFDDRPKAIAFIRRQLTKSLPDGPVACYYEALARMKDRSLLTTLEGEYLRYRNRDLPTNRTEAVNFLYCCYALWKIEEMPGYEASIRDFFRSEDDGLRSNARHLLERK